MFSIAKSLILIGLMLVLVGGTFYLIGKSGLFIGRLPGDIKIESGNFTCLIGLGTSILISLILTLVLNILLRFFIK